MDKEFFKLSINKILSFPHLEIIFIWNSFSTVVANLFSVGIISTHLVNMSTKTNIH